MSSSSDMDYADKCCRGENIISYDCGCSHDCMCNASYQCKVCHATFNHHVGYVLKKEIEANIPVRLRLTEEEKASRKHVEGDKGCRKHVDWLLSFLGGRENFLERLGFKKGTRIGA